jgi:hypothetical protein
VCTAHQGTAGVERAIARNKFRFWFPADAWRSSALPAAFPRVIILFAAAKQFSGFPLQYRAVLDGGRPTVIWLPVKNPTVLSNFDGAAPRHYLTTL